MFSFGREVDEQKNECLWTDRKADETFSDSLVIFRWEIL